MLQQRTELHVIDIFSIAMRQEKSQDREAMCWPVVEKREWLYLSLTWWPILQGSLRRQW